MARSATHRKAGNSQRSHIAAEAARILANDGINDYQLAKQKAIARLGISSQKNLPGNSEIELALHEHLQIFQLASLSRRVATRRQVALKAMKFFSGFEAKLVGAVLRGTVTESSEIQLHLVADTPEQVAGHLIENDIPYEICSRRIRYGSNRYEELPGYRFTAENVFIELLVFTPAGFREKPLSPIDGKAMNRASVRELERLLEAEPAQ